MVWISDLLYRIIHLPCFFHLITGLYCPGCGGTRAIKFLLTGQIGKSFLYHPLVPYAAAVIAAELLSALAAKVTGNRKWYLGREKWFLYLAVVILLGNWIFKNYMLVARGVDLLPEIL